MKKLLTNTITAKLKEETEFALNFIKPKSEYEKMLIIYLGTVHMHILPGYQNVAMYVSKGVMNEFGFDKAVTMTWNSGDFSYKFED